MKQVYVSGFCDVDNCYHIGPKERTQRTGIKLVGGCMSDVWVDVYNKKNEEVAKFIAQAINEGISHEKPSRIGKRRKSKAEGETR